MSESDDTDILLLIPPDFFLVNSSDSEDSIGPEKYTDRQDFERFVVNDLISQVNELENRICVIENKNSVDLPRNLWENNLLHQSFDSSSFVSSSCPYLQIRELPSKPRSMFTNRHKFGGSSDNFKSYQTVNTNVSNFLTTPPKAKQSLSLPATPSTDISKQNCPAHLNISRHSDGPPSPRGKNAITIERMTPGEILSMMHPVSDISAPSSKSTANTVSHSYCGIENKHHKDSTLLGEIDDFLDSVKKNPKPVPSTSVSEHKKEKPFQCGDKSTSVPDCGFGVRDFNSLPVREEQIQARHIAPLETNEPRQQLKELNPDEVNQFLRDLGDRSKNVDRPEPPNQSRDIYKCGDNEKSIPDLGFGLKAFSSLPVREELVTARSVLPLETYTMTPEMKGLQLGDVEKLLKQMEATQYEIEKKLQLREALLGKSVDSLPVGNNFAAPENTFLSGDTVGSVPDRGFGVRDIPYHIKPPPHKQSSSASSGAVNHPAGDGRKVPVHEDPVTKRNMYTVGSDVPPSEQSGHTRINQNTIMQHSQQQQQQNPSVSDHMAKVTLAKRKLELGGDANTVPDLGFGLKSWYQNSQDSASSSLPSFPIGTIHENTTTTNRSGFVQGDYLPSIPDLGFGVRSLWNSDTILESNPPSQAPSTSHSVLHTHKAKDLNSVEHSLLPQIEPPGVIGDIKHLKNQTQDQVDAIPIQKQSCLNVENQKAPPTAADNGAKKKVDFTVGSGRHDTLSRQQDYGAEGLRSKPDNQNTVADSGFATSISSGASNLFSLSELWGKETSAHGTQARDEEVNFRVKLEEERFRRQHCEKLIQQLQSRLLEEQQKLAVAVSVDKGKDQAIMQLQDAWTRLVQHWKELEEHRHSLAGKLQSEREAHQKQQTEMIQKLRQLESERSKALDLAQGYKDKNDAMEKEKLHLTESHKAEIGEVEKELKIMDEKLSKAEHIQKQLIQEKKEVIEKAKQAEVEAQKERKLLVDAQKELGSMRKKIETFEAEISALKEEKENLQLKLKEEKGRINILDQQKKSLQSALDESKKKEKSARDEVKQLNSQMEKMKGELREYYQEQLEIVVRDKLKEFQEQLDAAEAVLHKELEQREHTITEIASKQVKQISEKHQLEVQLLEEKHTEELQLYKLQLGQAMQHISQLETKLQNYSSRKSEIVEKLHGVMETHWQEALRIISGNSPLVNNGTDSKLQRGDSLTRIGSVTWPRKNQLQNAMFRVDSSHDQHVANENEEKFTRLKKVVTSTPHNTDPHFQILRQLPNLSQEDPDKHSLLNIDIPKEANLIKKFTPGEPSYMCGFGNKAPSTFKDTCQYRVPPLHLRDHSSSSTADESPFCRDGILTSRLADQQPVASQETPRSRGNYESDLKRYIMMLLNRSPGNPVTDEIASAAQEQEIQNEKKNMYHNEEKNTECSDVPSNEANQFLKWERILRQQESHNHQENMPSIPPYDLSKNGSGSSREGRQMKPPWK